MKKKKENSISRTQIIHKVAVKNKIPLKIATTIVNDFFDDMVKQLAMGNEVHCAGFATFKVHSRKSYKARNPGTGEKLIVPPKKMPSIIWSKNLKDNIDI